MNMIKQTLNVLVCTLDFDHKIGFVYKFTSVKSNYFCSFGCSEWRTRGATLWIERIYFLYPIFNKTVCFDIPLSCLSKQSRTVSLLYLTVIDYM